MAAAGRRRGGRNGWPQLPDQSANEITTCLFQPDRARCGAATSRNSSRLTQLRQVEENKERGETGHDEGGKLYMPWLAVLGHNADCGSVVSDGSFKRAHQMPGYYDLQSERSA